MISRRGKPYDDARQRVSFATSNRGAAGGRRAQDGGFHTLSYGPGPLVPMNLLLVLMVLLVIVLTYMARHGGYGP